MTMIDILNIDGKEIADVSNNEGFLKDAATAAELARTVRSNSTAKGIVINREAFAPELLDKANGFSDALFSQLKKSPVDFAVYGDFTDYLGGLEGAIFETDKNVTVYFTQEKTTAVDRLKK